MNGIKKAPKNNLNFRLKSHIFKQLAILLKNTLVYETRSAAACTDM